MTKLTLISAIVIALSWAALAHEGHEHATGVVRERMELMTDMGKRLLAISKRLRANKELDRIAPDARAIHELAAQDRGGISARQHAIPDSRKARDLAAMG